MKSSKDEGSLLTPNGAWAFAVFDKEDRGSNLLGLLLTNDACALFSRKGNLNTKLKQLKRIYER